MMAISGNPLGYWQDRTNHTLLYSQTEATHYMRVVRINGN